MSLDLFHSDNFVFECQARKGCSESGCVIQKSRNFFFEIILMDKTYHVPLLGARFIFNP